mmetsp:Transcript_47816/g.142818  ORF Transcript_47816/g.142818 Transcript_47816/m.142818 type:complete len:206 (+) Transcript_47816:647-1264(+)
MLTARTPPRSRRCRPFSPRMAKTASAPLGSASLMRSPKEISSPHGEWERLGKSGFAPAASGISASAGMDPAASPRSSGRACRILPRGLHEGGVRPGATAAAGLNKPRLVWERPMRTAPLLLLPASYEWLMSSRNLSTSAMKAPRCQAPPESASVTKVWSQRQPFSSPGSQPRRWNVRLTKRGTKSALGVGARGERSYASRYTQVF